jgi:hypothetical protein
MGGLSHPLRGRTRPRLLRDLQPCKMARRGLGCTPTAVALENRRRARTAFEEQTIALQTTRGMRKRQAAELLNADSRAVRESTLALLRRQSGGEGGEGLEKSEEKATKLKETASGPSLPQGGCRLLSYRLLRRLPRRALHPRARRKARRPFSLEEEKRSGDR